MNGLASRRENPALALFDPLAGVPAPIGDPDLRGRAGFDRADIVTFLIRALAARYPVVRRLIGDDSFLDVAQRFIAMQPPRLPVVEHFGETFPHYLRGLGEAASFEYVADMAELEAARARAYHSADAPPPRRACVSRSCRLPASSSLASCCTRRSRWWRHASRL